MKFFHLNQKLDLVDYGEIRVFMYKGEFFYEKCLTPDVKNYSLDRHYLEIEQKGHQPALHTVDSIFENGDSKYALQHYIAHLHRCGEQVTFLDIGAYVGVMSLLLGNFARTSRIAFRAIAFDPSLAGTLLPANIQLNGLSSYIQHRDLALGAFNGPMIFDHRIGHMDSASLGTYGEGDCQYLVTAQKVPDMIRQEGIGNDYILAKIDTEGLETVIIQGLLESCAKVPSFIFEFSPKMFMQMGTHPVQLLSTISREFLLYNIPCIPKPGSIRQIEVETEEKFVEDVLASSCGFTDVWAIPKRTPRLEELRAALVRISS